MSTKVIGFPSNPSVDDEYQGWVWDGDKWVSDAVKGGLWEQNGDDIYYSDGNVSVSNDFSASNATFSGTVTADKIGINNGGYQPAPVTAQQTGNRCFNGYYNGGGFFNLGATADEVIFNYSSSGRKGVIFRNGNFDTGVDVLKLDASNNATFSGTVSADEVSSGTMKLTNNGRLLRTDNNGIGLYLEGGSGNVILPTDKTGALVNDGPSLGNGTRNFKDAHFSGFVQSDIFLGASGSSGVKVQSTNVIAVDSSGASKGDTVDLGAASVKWRNGFFSGTVDATSFTINGVPISGGLPDGDFTHNGKITATDFIATSDERLKTRIAPMPLGLIDDIKPVSWDWIDGGGKSAGVVAQQLQEIGLGDYVHENEDGQLGVNYQALTAILLAEVIALKKAIK